MRLLIALSFTAFGVHQIIYGRFVSRAIGALPAGTPWPTFWAEITGFGLAFGGLAMGWGVRRAAEIIGWVCLGSALLLHLPGALPKAATGSSWVYPGKGLALAGCAFCVAASRGARVGRWTSDRLQRLASWPIAAFMILSGCLHFVYNVFVASLIPPWIPWPMFWTYFAAVALIAGGIGTIVPRTSRVAALLSGLMILSWVPLVHLPSAWHDPRDPGASVPVFEALAFGSALVLASLARRDASAGAPPRARVAASAAAPG